MKLRPDIAWSREFSRTTTGQIALWTTASVLMLAVHAGVAWWMIANPAKPAVEIAGSAAVEVDLAALGFSEADQVSAGEAAEAVDPVEAAEVEVTDAQVVTETTPVDVTPPAEIAQPVDTAPVETPPVERAEPVAEEQPVQPVAEEQRVQPVEVMQQEPVRAEVAPVPVSRLAEAVSEVQIAALPPVENEASIVAETAPAVEVETMEPVPEVEQQVAALTDVPRPTQRPENTQPRPRAEQPRRETPAPRQQTRRPAAGSGGQNQADARRGVAQGSTQGRAAQQSTGSRRNSDVGNAAVSNYPGEVARRLRRAVRPQRGRDRGEVVVSFTVGRSGSVSSVRVARGSGSANLDRAAVETVNRAAPFPPIPDAAGRSSWTFNLPIAFTR